MVERDPLYQSDDRFSDFFESPYLKMGTTSSASGETSEASKKAVDDFHFEGDPDTSEDFERSLSYLEQITQHFKEQKDFHTKTPNDIAYELSYHNDWHRYEVEEERKAGEKAAEYHEITIAHLSALSRRRIHALEQTGWEVTSSYRDALFLDRLIQQALLDEQHLQAQMHQGNQAATGRVYPSPQD